MNEHTPGPWAVSNVDYQDLKGVDEIISVSSMIRVIMPGSIWGSSSKECEANARLIAAAPDLLAALRQAISAYGRTCEQVWDGVPTEPWENAALAAIAKAEGSKS